MVEFSPIGSWLKCRGHGFPGLSVTRLIDQIIDGRGLVPINAAAPVKHRPRPQELGLCQIAKALFHLSDIDTR